MVRKKKAKKRRPDRTTLAAAVAHPTRVHALTILGERVASPSELAKETGEYVGKVGYHVSELAEAGLVEEVGCRPVRGAVEHFYKGVELPELTGEEEAKMSDEDRASFAESAVAMFGSDVSQAIQKRTYLERTDHHMTRLVRLTDAEGYEDLRVAYMELFERTQEIFEEGAKRMARYKGPKKDRPKPMRVMGFQAMMELPKVPAYGGPALDTLERPLSAEDGPQTEPTDDPAVTE